jgi:hypothetical protein
LQYWVLNSGYSLARQVQILLFFICACVCWGEVLNKIAFLKTCDAKSMYVLTQIFVVCQKCNWRARRSVVKGRGKSEIRPWWDEALAALAAIYSSNFQAAMVCFFWRTSIQYSKAKK